MRFVAHDGLGSWRSGLVALGLLALCAGSASAQMVFDGNLLFLNNNTGTLASQFTGAAGAGAPACGGLTAATLGTVTYTHNSYADPLLSGAIYPSHNFQPALGSPAFGSAMTVPAGFFEQVCYKGAIGPNPGDDWTQGWTYFDSTGASRSDLHLGSMPDPRPLATYSNINIAGNQYFGPDSNYLVRGQLRIKNGGVLTIAPGVVIFEEFTTLGTIIAERGGQIFAIGNSCEPIIITSDDTPGFMTRGHCGGIVLLGRAKINLANSCAGDSAASEGGAIGYYGGNDDNDGSGVLRYVRVEYAGKEITPNNELNSFTWCGCGRNTHGDYLEAFRGADDGFEWFGGTMDQKHLIAIDGTDDGYDWQMGTRNRAQFVVVRVSPNFAPSGTQNGDKGIEADNNEFGFDEVQCSGRSFSQVVNATFVGDRRFGAAFPGPSQGVNFRRGTEGTFLNSIVYNFKSGALKVDDDATWQAHCLAPPATPAVYCPGTLGVEPFSSGRVFVAQSRPNPFRNEVTFNFTLPQSGPVSIEIYSADGRHVDTLTKGEMAAGEHSVAWTLGKNTPSGMYFYRVIAGNNQATGKLTRVD
jgi:hypothetical protein